MVWLNTTRRAVGQVAINRQYNARPVDPFSNLGCGNADHAPVPPGAGDDSHVRIGRLGFSALQFSNCELHYLLLNLLSLLVARVEMQSQAPRFVLVPGAEKFHNGARGIHSARSVDSGAKTESDVIGSQTGAITAPRYFHQRT